MTRPAATEDPDVGEPRATSHPLRVATWNIRHGRGRDGRVDLPRVARVLMSLDADIVALQEVDRGRSRSHGVHQAAELAAALGLHYHFCETVALVESPSAKYGHALLVRGELEDARAIPFGLRRLREPRSFVAARAMLTRLGPRTPLNVLSTHLGLLEWERRGQVDSLVRAIGKHHPDAPIMLLGDLNAPSYAKSMQRLREQLVDTGARSLGKGLLRWMRSRTWPSALPFRRLDYVYVSHHFVLRTIRTVRDPEARRASDHLPVLVELELRGTV